MTDFLAPYATYALPALVGLLLLGLLAFLIREIVKAPLTDAYGNPVDPTFGADVDQAIANVADREDAFYLRTGHRDHELPGGVL